jgi:hypothetical protein
MNSTSSISHENISRRAYQIWEQDGQPDGQETAHWLQAEHELRAQHEKASGTDAARGKAVEPPLVAKHLPERAPHSANYVHPGVTTDALHHRRH